MTLTINPRNPQFKVNWARALVKLGRREEAIAHVNEALRLNPSDSDAKQLLNLLNDEHQ